MAVQLFSFLVQATYRHRVCLKKFVGFYEKRNTRAGKIEGGYLPGSIKESTRKKRGSGIHIKVSSQVKIQSNWKAFLRDSKNKEEILDFLSDDPEIE